VTAADPRATSDGGPWAADGDVLVTVADGVATLTLCRPPGNAWTPALGARYFSALESAALDPDVRAIVVTGDGKDFCIGADGGGLDNIAHGDGYTINPARPNYWMAMTVGKPVIAAINGACFGIGMQLALFCDIRFASTSTKLATAFVRRGLIAELGMTWLLPRLVGIGAANDLLLSGRIVRAPEARRFGLVKDVVEDGALLDTAAAYARQLASTCSPAAMAVIKRQTYADLTSTLPAAVARGDAYLQVAMSSEDFAEGVRSWRDQRAPVFPPLDSALARFPIPGDDGPNHDGDNP
jgi:enoyl-CoA hydratase/carnithine racemase